MYEDLKKLFQTHLVTSSLPSVKNYNLSENLEYLFDKENSYINKAVYGIFIHAINCKSSDIHFEALSENFRIRFRIDGLLQEIIKIDKILAPAIISKIKLLSSLDIVEKRRPQDGRFSLIYQGREIDFRSSVIPTINGEKIVIRILDKFYNNFSIDDLYLSENNKKIFFKAINQSSGMILINGPTGSGKSSTLYSILKYKNSKNINISTVEDPIEYQIDGVNQIQCKNEIGLDFAFILRSLLRQDPDILMIGEIRDKETAEIAVKASLTGHLIFSTLHSNDTFGSINRLINLDIDPYLLSLVLIMIVSQRLVRKLCPHCKKNDENAKQKLIALGVKEDFSESSFFTHSETGCDFCMNTGYSGRIPIFEFLFFNDEIKHLFSKNKLKSSEIKFDTLLDDAISKASQGLTSLDEIMRQL